MCLQISVLPFVVKYNFDCDLLGTKTPHDVKKFARCHVTNTEGNFKHWNGFVE